MGESKKVDVVNRQPHKLLKVNVWTTNKQSSTEKNT
jgi:hypothetical protein